MKKITKLMATMLAILTVTASMSIAAFADVEGTDTTIGDSSVSDTFEGLGGDAPTDSDAAWGEDGSTDGSIDGETDTDGETDGETDGTDDDASLEDDAIIDEGGEDAGENEDNAEAGDVNAPTEEDKASPDTGVEGVAGVAGVAIVAAGALLMTGKKRK